MLKHVVLRAVGSIAVALILVAPALAQSTSPSTPVAARPDSSERPDSSNARSHESPNDLYQRVSQSLVAVQWTWAYEYGRAEYFGAGIVVRDDGLIAIPMQVADPGIPDCQMT